MRLPPQRRFWSMRTRRARHGRRSSDLQRKCHRPTYCCLPASRANGRRTVFVRKYWIQNEVCRRTIPRTPLAPDDLIVVATQTLEVGADIDAGIPGHGGLRRPGAHPEDGDVSTGSGVSRTPGPPMFTSTLRTGTLGPFYGQEPATVLQRLLDARGRDEDAIVNLSPRVVTRILGSPLDDPGRAPEVLPDILWEWAKTTTIPEGEAPVEPYFSGISAPGLSVTVIWRTYIPPNGERLWPRATDREAIDVPIADVRRIFGEERVCRLEFDGVTTEQVVGTSLRPGDRIVVSSDRGLMDRFGWNPESAAPVADVSLANHGLPLDSATAKRLCGVELGQLIDKALGIADDDSEVDETERHEAVSTILTTLKDAATPPGWDDAEWGEFANSLRPRVIAPRSEVARLPVQRPAPEPLYDEFDELSLVLGPVAKSLDHHGRAVGTRAGQIGKCVGIPDDLMDVVERARDTARHWQSRSSVPALAGPGRSVGLIACESPMRPGTAGRRCA